MMKRVLMVVLIVLLSPVFCLGLEIAEGVVTTAITERQPTDTLVSVSADVGEVYCFTRVVGAESDTVVSHVWLWQGREMAKVALTVKSNNWRTWSSKRILPEWRGDWTVSVQDEAGVELTSVAFIVE